MALEFIKMHGTGNDFIVIDPADRAEDWPSLARRMCDRHFGIGADGLILVLPSEVADFRMRMFNPDGSEAEMCGNGIRCFAKYVVERGLWRSKKAELLVETVAGLQHLQPMGNGAQVTSVQVGMGVPQLAPAAIPVLAKKAPSAGPVLDHPIEVAGRRLLVNCVSMGNPHAVTFITEPVSEFPLRAIGPSIEHHPDFPERVNFEIVNVVGPREFRMRVWERGAGETLACGTGACAAAVAARLQGLAADAVTIHLPGGRLQVKWDGVGEVLLTGAAEAVFRGTWFEEGA